MLLLCIEVFLTFVIEDKVSRTARGFFCGIYQDIVVLQKFLRLSISCRTDGIEKIYLHFINSVLQLYLKL